MTDTERQRAEIKEGQQPSLQEMSLSQIEIQICSKIICSPPPLLQIQMMPLL